MVLSSQAVKPFGGRRFGIDVEGLRCPRLHAEGQLERGDAGAELAVLLAPGAVQLVETAQGVELLPLASETGLRVFEVGDGVLEIADKSALVGGGQETAAPQRRALRGWAGLMTTKPGKSWFSLPRP